MIAAVAARRANGAVTMQMGGLWLRAGTWKPLLQRSALCRPLVAAGPGSALPFSTVRQAERVLCVELKRTMATGGNKIKG
jgi:hypothetical protein